MFISGIPRPYFSALSYSPLSSYPFYASPWMGHQWIPYPAPYCHYLPYSYSNANNNGYINYYETQYSRIIESASYDASGVNTPATATSANIRAEAQKTDENVNNEQLVIDKGGPNEEELQQDGTV